MKHRYTGSCHCGVVRVEVSADRPLQSSKCNCSICTKMRFWKAIVLAANFRLISGEEGLSGYRFGQGNICHQFCATCGVKVFGNGEAEALGGEFYAINVASLDISPRDLADAIVQFQDGRNDKFECAPQIASYL